MDIDCQNTNGDTALHDSASRGMMGLTSYLLQKGANPNILNLVGETPLHKAVQTRAMEASLQLVKLLVEHGADVSACGLTGSPLTIALMCGNEPVAEFLKTRKHSSINSGDYRVHAAKRYGPSYENIDMATLLGIRPSSGSGGIIAASQKPGPDDIVEFNDHFNFELGLAMEVMDDLADLKVDDDLTTLDYKGKDHTDFVNIIGVFRTPSLQAGHRRSFTSPATRRASESSHTSSSKDKEKEKEKEKETLRDKDGSTSSLKETLAAAHATGSSSSLNGSASPPISSSPGTPPMAIPGSNTTPPNSARVHSSSTGPIPSVSVTTTAPFSSPNGGSQYGVKNMPDEKSMTRRLFCISVLKTNDNGKMPGIIRTSSGDHRFYIPVSAFPKDKSVQSISPKDVLKELQKEIPELDLKGICKSVVVDTPELYEQLANFEKTKVEQSSHMKIGVLYAKKGQTTESEILGNEHGSEEFESFLKQLGDVIELKGWQGFKGDLDVKHNGTGTQSLFTTFRKTDIMFHVSTYLPHSTDDEQQIARKRCIGNDLTTIIYLEEGAVFKPPCVSGDFLHIFAAVQPATTKEGKPGFRVAFSSREGVPNFGPILPKPAIFSADGGYFRDFLLTKLINGERASLHSQFLINKMTKTRQGYLEELMNRFAPQLEDWVSSRKNAD